MRVVVVVVVVSPMMMNEVEIPPPLPALRCPDFPTESMNGGNSSHSHYAECQDQCASDVKDFLIVGLSKVQVCRRSEPKRAKENENETSRILKVLYGKN